MAERVSIYGSDAAAAILVRAATMFVSDGVRNACIDHNRRGVILEAIRALSSHVDNLAGVIKTYPDDAHWVSERDAYLAIIAFLRTLLPADPAPETPAEGVSAC
jgi:hypothetical protein